MYIPPLYSRTGAVVTPEPPPNRGAGLKAAADTILEAQPIKQISSGNNSNQKTLPPATDGRGSRVDILV
ncbi:hypothetical protein [Kiloniella antarctica]|uniref:Uncharacterized protein n=1 Tax=Kiloniella antarctica TaxID=1550907 RepID=A0ABW5BM73_9PROT